MSAYEEYWELVGTTTTNSFGVFSFDALPFGIYMLLESKANPAYLSASESLATNSTSDVFATARIFVFDKTHPLTTQVWEDKAISLECSIDKSTIDVTSAGLISKTQSEGGELINNVGVEEYRYDVAFNSGNSNTYADEYWLVDELDMCDSPYDLCITKLVLPTLTNDTTPGFWVLIKTNMSAADVWMPTVETDVHSSSLADGTSRFDGTGYKCLGYFSEGAVLDMANYLTSGETLDSLCLYFGAVEEGFSSVSPLSYMVCATHELREGITIPNTASSHITRNWAVREGEPGGLHDDDVDSVKTLVIGTFEVVFEYTLHGFEYGHIGVWIPQMGDSLAKLIPALLIAAAIALGVFVALRRKERSRHEEQ